jgi:arylsulfatase
MVELQKWLGPLWGWIFHVLCNFSGNLSPRFCSHTPTEASGLNVLILYGDDWRYDSIGVANPNIPIRTPNLDQLSREGIRFTHACVTTSICWVSRATYFTGQYMSRHRSIRLDSPIFYNTWYETSWPAHLQRNQYYVGHIGKWQFDDSSRFVEKAFNFSSLFEGQHQNATGYRVTDLAVDETIRFLDAHAETNRRNNGATSYHPFALTIALYPPKAVQYSPVPADNYQARAAEYDLYRNLTIPNAYGNDNISYSRLPYFLNDPVVITESRRRYQQIFIPASVYQETLQRYYALVTEVDAACGRILQELKDRNLYDNTLILFTTDNGYFHGEHGLSGKWYPYQESIRVPLVLRDPRQAAAHRGTTRDEFVLNVDLAATLVGAAQPTEPAGQHQQGCDLAALYRNGSSSAFCWPWRTDFFYEHHSLGRTYITSSTAVIQKQYSYLQWPEWNAYEELFDLTLDPQEQVNRINDSDYSEIVRVLRERHAIYRQQVL